MAAPRTLCAWAPARSTRALNARGTRRTCSDEPVVRTHMHVAAACAHEDTCCSCSMTCARGAAAGRCAAVSRCNPPPNPTPPPQPLNTVRGSHTAVANFEHQHRHMACMASVRRPEHPPMPAQRPRDHCRAGQGPPLQHPGVISGAAAAAGHPGPGRTLASHMCVHTCYFFRQPLASHM